MEKQRLNTFRMVMLAMMVAIGVVISPILRIEGMCPTAHLINIVCSVLMGPWYSLLCATMIGVIRMLFMGIPPLALTGAVFGAFLSGVFLPFIRWKNHLCGTGRNLWNRYHRITGFLPGDGIYHGKRRVKCIFLHPDVYFSNDHGRCGSVCVPESTEQGRIAGKISEKSWSKSL